MFCRAQSLNRAAASSSPLQQNFSVGRGRGEEGGRETEGVWVSHLAYNPRKCRITLPEDNLFSAETSRKSQASKKNLGVRQWHKFCQKCGVTSIHNGNKIAEPGRAGFTGSRLLSFDGHFQLRHILRLSHHARFEYPGLILHQLPTRPPHIRLVNKENLFSSRQMEDDGNRRARLHLGGWALRPH